MKQPSRARAATKAHVILFLAADPSELGHLDLDREARSIHVELRRSGYRDRFDFVTRWAAEPLDLLRVLRELQPTVVHFSGHGSARLAATTDSAHRRDVVAASGSPESELGGLYFHSAAGGGQMVSPEALARTLAAAGSQVRLVVLNACFTEPIAEGLLAHVDCVVGMSGAIHDDAARSFALGFYGGLGEHESIAAAFEQGKAAIDLKGLPDAEQPRLKVREGFDAAQLILAAVAPSVLVDVTCPYPGMRPYAADDADGFHGRDAEIADLIGRLRAGEREIYVIGPSGSGKSSLVAAGVLPLLARGVARLGPFVVRELRPGDQPVARLRQALDVPAGEPMVVVDRVAGLLAHRGPGASLLIVIDQLEELFTLASGGEREQFLAALRAFRAERRCAVVFTLRADFFGALMESALWPERRGQLSRVEVSPLRGEALREAIAAPARAVGVTVEPELIERLVADAASEPGILPLLQETMVQLWDVRVDQTLTLADYQKLSDGERSGLAVALARRADATLRRFTLARTAIACRILLRLTSFGEGRSDTRRQQPLSELCATAEDAQVLQQMIDDRLLTATEDDGHGEPRVDLAHEILIAAWPTLAGWIQSHRLDEQRRRQLESRAVLWIEHKRSAHGLLDSLELAEAEAWQRTKSARDLGQSDVVVELIAASKTACTRRRRGRILEVTGVALAIGIVVLSLMFRMLARRELEVKIMDHMDAANAASIAAQQVSQRKDAARIRAFQSFDSRRWGEGEALWDEVAALDLQQAEHYRAAADHLGSALSLDPARHSLRERFADLTFERLLCAERDHRGDLANEWARLLGTYDDGRYQSALVAGARVELEVVPAGTLAWAERSGAPRQLLGQAPLPPLTLPPGSVILVFEAPGRLTIRFPVLLARSETLRQRIVLPLAATAPPGMIYVPPGRFLFGSADPDGPRRGFLRTPPIHEVQTGAYYIGRYEVTFGQWIEFLEGLPAGQRRLRSPAAVDLKTSLSLTETGPRRWRLSLTPTVRTYTAETNQRLRYEHRTHRIEQDWARFPVSGVSYDDAMVYAAWLDRTERVKGARLCDEYEWERAARGADGRTFPSGSSLAPDDANLDLTYGRDPLAFGPDEVGSHTASRSPVGAEDMAGNVWEWTRSVEIPDAPVERGGGWYYGATSARSMNREPADPMLRHILVGVRVCATPAQ